MKIKALATSAFAAFLIAAGAYNSNAQSIAPANDVPRTISYQGNLADNYGKALPDGSYRITLSLFADPAGSVMVWQDTYDALVINGIFNLYLGAGSNPLPDPAKLNAALWIGTQVGDAPLMHPLTPLSASPYALNVPDRAITTGKLADGAVTADKVDMNYIAGLQINDRQIAGTGTVLKLKGSDAITLDYDETTNSVTIGAGNGMERGTSGDDGKGSQILDVTYTTSNNWLGRNLGSNLPSYTVPNALSSTYNTMGGGHTNLIEDNTHYSTIVGGYGNEIVENSDYSHIGGGQANIAAGDHGAITGGEANEAEGDWSSIIGGSGNIVRNDYGTIGGGIDNLIIRDYATIGGGRENFTEAPYSTIPGGDHLKTTGYAQTSVGFYSAPRGYLTSIPTTAAKAANNDPLFIVGNGTPSVDGGVVTRTNAFEVSYNGHATVFDVNGTTRNPIKGATYVDNIIYAWGDINSGGGILSDFGVISVTHIPFSGVYDVRIDVRDPLTGAPITLASGSVTATLTELDESTPCAFIHCSRIGAYAPNQFRVRIRDANCQPLDAHFMFKLTGRP